MGLCMPRVGTANGPLRWQPLVSTFTFPVFPRHGLDSFGVLRYFISRLVLASGSAQKNRFHLELE